MKFKVATLNFWGTLWPLSFDKNLRYKNLVHLIKKNKIDVISFQELWSKKDFSRLKDDFPTYHFRYGKFGLALMSKFPMKNCKYKSFDRINGSIINKLLLREAMFTKGFMDGTLFIGDRKIKIINTHVNYFANRANPAYLKQISEVFKYAKNYKSILCGDFNADLGTISIPRGLFILSDRKSETLSSKNRYSNTFFNKFHHKKWMCDLIFSSFKPRSYSGETIRTPLVSDHYLVIAKIEL